MSGPKPLSAPQTPVRRHRSWSTPAAFLIGVPLAAGVLFTIQRAPVGDSEMLHLARRYVGHTVEWVEVILFCCALGALGTKLWCYRKERAACRAAILPSWDGKPVPVTEAAGLLAKLNRLPRRLQNSYLVNRVAAVLDFVCSRSSANELDDQMRMLADNDAITLEGSYSLTRFITWAIPILGFLGTVLGITASISGITPEKLEKDLSQVTDGLALAFDATALGLALTMITMFVSFIVERAEQSVLEAVDRYVDRYLAHRFERTAAEGGEFIAVVRQNTDVLVQATEQLVRKQAEVWAAALEQADRRRAEAEQKQHQGMTVTLETAMQRSLETHTRLVAALQKQVVDQSGGLLKQMEALAGAMRDTGKQQEASLANVARGVAARTEALVHLQEGEKEILRLQENLDRNLQALAGANAFEEAVHSLTAAIHLLTVRSADLRVPGVEPRPTLRKGPGAAA